MSISNLKLELADHICRYLCHEAQYSDLPEQAKESLTAASERIEQAYRLCNTNLNKHSKDSGPKSPILPDELIRIFTRHKEYATQHRAETSKYSLRNESESSTPIEKPDIKVSSHHHLHHQTSSSASNAAAAASSSSSSNQPQIESGGGANNSGSSKKRSSRGHLHPGAHHLMNISMRQKKLKQKLIALIKKFRTDGSDFDSEEQYREALERELMKAAAGRGSKAIEELLEEDIDVEDESNNEQDDWDNVSETSTPKPSLRPFFSSTTLDKI